MRLYPRLPHRVARQLAREVAALPLEELERRSALSHKAQWFTPTGGNRVAEAELTELRDRLRDLARWRGYPAPLNRNARRYFDAELAVFLHTRLGVSPAEAAHGEIWAFMGCVLLPELVRWRFPGDEAGKRYLERFLGLARGIRNLYGRTWWRAEVLRAPGSQRPYELLERLGKMSSFRSRNARRSPASGPSPARWPVSSSRPRRPREPPARTSSAKS